MAQWIVVVASAVVALALRWGRRTGAGAWLVWASATVAALAVTAGPHELRKAVSLLAMPLGLAWLLALAVFWRARRTGDRVGARLAALVAAALYLAGNVPLATGLVSRLERPWRERPRWPREPLDAVAVLGGGVGLDPAGRPQLTRAGDRVRVGVAALRRGVAPVLVVTGPLVATSRGGVSLAEAAAALCVELGASAEAVRPVTGPRTTCEEVRALARLAHEAGWRRVGIVTSAWHLRRAMALARREGLPAVAIPADFRGTWSERGIRSLVPQADGLLLEQRFWWEVLGRLAGR